MRKIFPTVPDKNFDGLEDFTAYRVAITITKIKVELPRVIVDTQITATWTSFSGKADSGKKTEKMTFIESKDGEWVRVQ